MELTRLRSSLGHSLLHRRALETAGSTAERPLGQSATQSVSSNTNDSLSTIPHLAEGEANESALFGASIAEADQLLGQFRESFLSMAHSEELGRHRLSTTESSAYHQQQRQQSSSQRNSRIAASQELAPIDRETYRIQEGDREHSATATSTNSATAQVEGASSADEPSVAELSAVLDKYSDKLVDLLGEKLLTKLSSSQQPQI